jgi:hypothetical protein
MSIARTTPLSRHAATAQPTGKNEEDDPFGSGEEEKNANLSDRRKKSHFKPASIFTPMGSFGPSTRLKCLALPHPVFFGIPCLCHNH